MGEPILIYGISGSGKSRSLLNFAEDEILLVNTIGKRLPFKKRFKYELRSDNITTITEQLQKMPVKTAVIDDAGYLLTNMFMSGHGKGDQFKLFNEIADSFWSLLNFIKWQLSEDTLVYIIMHEDSNERGETRLKTIGKLLNEKVCIEGMTTVCLHCTVKAGQHIFVTQSNGLDISKSPEGMLEKEEPNDLKTIDTKIREYWQITKKTNNKE